MPPRHRNGTIKKMEAKAREIAIEHGHKDPDHMVVCDGGTRREVWRFYVDEAYERLAPKR